MATSTAGYSLKEYFGGKNTEAYRKYKEGQKAGKWSDLPGYLSQGGGTSGSTSGGYQDVMANQVAQENEYLNRFGQKIAAQPTIQDIFNRLATETGLTPIRQQAQGLQQAYEEIPAQQKIAGKQFGISSSRLGRRITEAQTGLAPAVQKAQTQEQNVESGIREQLALESAQQTKELLPLQTEAGMISSRLAQAMTGWTTERQGQLDQLLEKLKGGNELSKQELVNAGEMAKQEEDFLHQVQLLKEKQKLTTLDTGW